MILPLGSLTAGLSAVLVYDFGWGEGLPWPGARRLISHATALHRGFRRSAPLRRPLMPDGVGSKRGGLGAGARPLLLSQRQMVSPSLGHTPAYRDRSTGDARSPRAPEGPRVEASVSGSIGEAAGDGLPGHYRIGPVNPAGGGG